MPQLSVFIDDPIPRAIAGFLLALLVAIIAGRARSLTGSGVVATTLVGGSVVAGAGWWAGIILILYFVSSSSLSSLTRGVHGASEQARGRQRDAWQVLANGGVAAVFALTSLLGNHPEPLIMATVGSIAGATADTWATELGRFSRSSRDWSPRGKRYLPAHLVQSVRRERSHRWREPRSSGCSPVRLDCPSLACQHPKCSGS